MTKSTQRTSFTKDVQGRYLCNDHRGHCLEKHRDRPLDVIVIGGGTFGSAIAEHIWFRQKQTGGGLRTLVLPRRRSSRASSGYRPIRGRCCSDAFNGKHYKLWR